MTTTFTSGLGTERSLERYDDIRHLLPDVDKPTPLVRVGRAMPEGGLDFYLKLEWLNPFGSIKDRAAAYMLAALSESAAGRELVEASSGNTAIALAALAAVGGTRLTVTIPDAFPRRRRCCCACSGPRCGRPPTTCVRWTTPAMERSR